jgi:hypothetical protein
MWLVTQLSKYRYHGLKYADLSSLCFFGIKHVARKLTEFEYYGLAELLKTLKNLSKSTGAQREFHMCIAKYL